MRCSASCSHEEALLLTTTPRLVPWQTGLKPGDYFLVVVQDGVILYVEVMPEDESEGKLHPRFRRVRVFSEVAKEGADDIIDLHMADLPMSAEQFELARSLNWPSQLTAMRGLMGMSKPARA